MRNMFYNYDHNIKNLDHLKINTDYIETDKLESCSCVEILTNKKGDELGVIAKEGSNFYLYFDFYSNSEEDLHTIMAEGELACDILDNKREIIATAKPELCDFINEIRVAFNSSAEGPLKYGVYRLHLYLKYKDTIYTIFSPEDGILNIK